jgi:hypothetical protein
MFHAIFFALLTPSTLNRFKRSGAFVALLVLISPVCAQDHTILFSPSDPGVTRSITNWGMDTGVISFDVAQRDLIFMGTNTVNFVQVAFEANAPLTNNDLSAAQKVDLTNMLNLASMAPSANRWIMSCGTGAGVDPWYQSGTGTVYPDRWAALMCAWQRNFNKTMWITQPFNEPDYGWGQGSQQNLYDIMGDLRASNNFVGTRLGGGCTLNCDYANSWYDSIASRAFVGTTHAINGSVSGYVSFIQNVLANNAMPLNPEVHNLGEAIIGANYGLQGVSWWLAAELARGSFANTCQGQRLGYADDWTKWTAAAVYRGTNGVVQAFLGGSERMGATTSYRFFSKDRDVFYNGDGPRRDFTVNFPGTSEQVINITWGADVQPVISGRYIVVNRNSGKVMEVPNASTSYGTVLDQNDYTGASNQLWDVYPLASSFGGDLSYYTMTVVHDGVTADESNWSYNDGNPIIQWGTGANLVEHWYFEYAGDGYFRIRSRWSGKCVGVLGASLDSGAQIVQWDSNGSNDQQWRLIPAGAAVEFVAPAAPTGVSALANAVSLQLNWNTNSESDLASYTVLRGTNSGGPYEIVARGLTNNAFTDKSANQARTFYYVVKAVDRSLNTSGNSVEVSATPSCGPTLVARYAFDGNTSDSSGNANDANAIGSPAFVAGEHGSAMSLNGTSQYAMVPAGIMAGITNFTIAAWVYWNGGNAWQRIFDFGNDTTQYLFLTPDSGSGTLRFAISTNGNAPGAEQILETSPLPVGQWQHIAVTRNGNIARLYTNGVLAVSGFATIAPASFNPALNYFGQSQYTADPYFNGRLDEAFLYNYALSDTEITRLMNNQPPPPAMPTTLSAILDGSMLSLSWPSNYLGCRLQAQTNSISAGLGTNWFDVAGSILTNNVVAPMNSGNGSVFYRLIYP